MKLLTYSNNFYEKDIGPLLKRFVENGNVQHLSIADNPNIHGKIPSFKLNITDTDNWVVLNSLMAHNCDLSGTIPSDLNFTALNMITLHGNRLSGTIPTHISMSSFNISLILLGNLFFTDTDNKLPDWLESPFRKAPNLYITQYDQYLSITLSNSS